MVIGIDLDEVLAELIEQMLEENDYKIGGKKLSFEDITDYYIYKIPGLDISTDEAILYFRNVLLNDIEKLEVKPSKGVYEKLKKWKQQGHILKVITARPSELFKDYTLSWLNKHYPNIFENEVYFANDVAKFITNGKDSTNKGTICQNLGVDVMMEDNPEYAYNVACCGIKTYLISKPWNKNYKKHKNIIKVDSFEKIDI